MDRRENTDISDDAESQCLVKSLILSIAVYEDPLGRRPTRLKGFFIGCNIQGSDKREIPRQIRGIFGKFLRISCVSKFITLHIRVVKAF